MAETRHVPVDIVAHDQEGGTIHLSFADRMSLEKLNGNGSPDRPSDLLALYRSADRVGFAVAMHPDELRELAAALIACAIATEQGDNGPLAVPGGL